MTLVTGTPIGTIETQEDIFLEGAPTIYFQDANAPVSVDTNGFYWKISGSATYPIYEVGCPTDVVFSENLTMNDVLCDNVGVKAVVQQRNYFEFTFSIQSFFPLQVLTNLLNGGTVVEDTVTHVQLMPLGKINNDQFWHLYAPKVYNELVGDYVWIYLSKTQFVDAFSIAMTLGTPWKATGLKMRAFADTTKPAQQLFGVFGRSDASVII
jgi:hypothetical protein